MHALLNKDLATCGLTGFGACAIRKGDSLPGTPRSLLLAGNAGSGFWPHFAASPEYADGTPDPLNRWSARVLGEIAQKHGAGIVFPFEGPPYHPFQQWALRAGNVSRSPLGVLAHKKYGLWFAYRAAFLLPEPVAPVAETTGGPCDTCVEKPCLDACPAAALTRAQSYDVTACRIHVAGEGAESCGSRGCLVRHACPFGQDHAYIPNQAAFHMRAFIA